MVTLCYLRRYLAFCKSLFEAHKGSVEVSIEVAEWLAGIVRVLERHRAILEAPAVSDEDRRTLLDELGSAFSDYRDKVYRSGFSGSQSLEMAAAVRLCDVAMPYLDHSIRANRRDDGLYHSYNLVDLRDSATAPISPLYEMLEGQVAVLSAGVLSPTEVSDLIGALFDSRTYRPGEGTFMLYPERSLPGFLEKNVVSKEEVHGNPLLQRLLDSRDERIVLRDAAGKYRFAPSLHNAMALKLELDALTCEPCLADLVRDHRKSTMDSYESVFNHRFFTGRSGAMYAYEGLGSIYWHMVSKLLVAVQESFFHAARSGASKSELKEIADGYYRIRSGMGFNKTPQEFGAFPPDPYSHTPSGRGAKQPGMTGQSKEDILSRWMEFGVFSLGGRIEFRPAMLRTADFLSESRSWEVRGIDGDSQVLVLPKDSLGFTICGVPVIYQLGKAGPQTVVETFEGTEEIAEGVELSVPASRSIFARSGTIKQITVSLTVRELFQ